MHYPKGAVVYTQGDAAAAVFYLQSGQLKLTVFSPTGKEAVIGILKPGDFLGEDCLAGQSTRIATATATEDSTAIRIEKAEMARLLRTEQEFSDAFLSFLLARKARMEEDLIDQFFHSTEKRLARVLLLLARTDRSNQGVVPRITHETLAQMVGTTRARVSTLMSQFRKQGLIDYKGEIKVNDSLADFVFRD
ncbi:MAG: Crp/Fnr family transcriptional regulator [Acidobacteriota bacterium]